MPCLYSGLNFASSEGEVDNMSSLSVIVHAVVDEFHRDAGLHLHALGYAVETCHEVGVVHAYYGSADLLVAHPRLQRADDFGKLVVCMV